MHPFYHLISPRYIHPRASPWNSALRVLRVTDRSRTLEAVGVLRELGGDSIYGVPETGEVSLPAIGDTSMLADIVRRMDAAGIVLDELALKPPTLDDVFLAITGHTAEKANEVNIAESTQRVKDESKN